MNGALAGGASPEVAAAPPKRLGAGPEEGGALEAAAELLTPKEKVGLGAAGESEETREKTRSSGWRWLRNHHNTTTTQHKSSSQVEL